MENKKLPKPVMVEIPEEGLIGQEIVFQLRKGGKTINFGTVKSVTPTDDGVLLNFDPNKPGLAKYAPGDSKKNQSD